MDAQARALYKRNVAKCVTPLPRANYNCTVALLKLRLTTALQTNVQQGYDACSWRSQRWSTTQAICVRATLVRLPHDAGQHAPKRAAVFRIATLVLMLHVSAHARCRATLFSLWRLAQPA